MHPSFFALAIVAVAHQIWRHGSSGGAVLASAGLAVSVLHMELGRRVLLGRAGVHVREIRLTPLGGVLRTTRPPATFAASSAMAFGEIPFSFLAALAAAGVLALVARGPCLVGLFAMNVGLAAIQLLPLYPLGLGRLLVLRRPSHAALGVTRASLLTQVAAIALAIAALFFRPLLAIPALLLFVYAGAEQSVAAFDAARITGRFGQEY